MIDCPQNFRGAQLPSILTEDADEESAAESYPTHCERHLHNCIVPNIGAKLFTFIISDHTVTGATPGIRQLLKPSLLSRDDERGRHKSGDQEGSRSLRGSLMDIFRPRSKSDTSKLKKPNIVNKMSSAVQVCKGILAEMRSNFPDHRREYLEYVR